MARFFDVVRRAWRTFRRVEVPLCAQSMGSNRLCKGVHREVESEGSK